MICTGFALGFAYLVCQEPPATDTFCQNYKPVYWSRHDTRGTKEQNDSNNKKWVRLCQRGTAKK